MTSHRARAAEELLAAADPTGRLGAALRAATAPAHTDELAGEGAAVTAYREAATLVAPRPSRFRSALAKFLTIKAVIIVTVAGSAGIVVAATGGVLPGPWSAPEPPPVEQPSVTTPAPPVKHLPPSPETPPGPPADKPKPAAPGKPVNKPNTSDKPSHPRGDKHDVRDREDRAGDDDDQGDGEAREAPGDKPAKPAKPGKPDRPPRYKKEPSRDAGTPPTPVSPTRGVTPPVPPSDVTAPSQGG